MTLTHEIVFLVLEEDGAWTPAMAGRLQWRCVAGRSWLLQGIASTYRHSRSLTNEYIRHAECTRDETIDLLRRNGAAVAAMLCGLTDEQLQQTAVVRGRTVTLQERIQNGLLGHIRSHLEAVRETVS